MKFKRELINGFIIFLGIAFYFLIIEFLGLADEFYLRLFNLFIVAFGINRSISQNYHDAVLGYNTNLFVGIWTAIIGALLSVGGLYFYIQYNGGTSYLQKLSDGFLFGGGDVNVAHYCIGLLFESVASSIIITFVLMQFWKNKVETSIKVG